MKLISVFNSFFARYKNQKIIRFATHLCLLAFAWVCFYHFFRYSIWVNYFYEYATYYLTKSYLYTAQFILNVLQYQTHVHDKVLEIVGSQGVLLDRGCLGRNVMAAFVAIILAFPGKIVSKSWFTPLGLIILHASNSIRIAALTLSFYYYPGHNFDDHALFNNIIYLIVFLLWVLWFSKINPIADKEK